MSQMSDPQFIIEVEKKVLVVEIQPKEILGVDVPQRVVINKEFLPPASGESIIEDYEAASNINVNRAVVLLSDGRIAHADKDTPSHNLDVIGVSKTSGVTGQLVSVVKYGKLTGASFGAIAENFFLGNTGQLLSVAPSSGNWLYIGIQETASEFFVSIGESIEL